MYLYETDTFATSTTIWSHSQRRLSYTGFTVITDASKCGKGLKCQHSVYTHLHLLCFLRMSACGPATETQFLRLGLRQLFKQHVIIGMLHVAFHYFLCWSNLTRNLEKPTSLYLIRYVRKRTFGYVRLAKIQISLCIGVGRYVSSVWFFFFFFFFFFLNSQWSKFSSNGQRRL